MAVNAANKLVERVRWVSFDSQKFKLFADVCSSEADKSSTSVLSSLHLSVFNLAFCSFSCSAGSEKVHRPFCIIVFRIFRYRFRQ